MYEFLFGIWFVIGVISYIVSETVTAEHDVHMKEIGMIFVCGLFGGLTLILALHLEFVKRGTYNKTLFKKRKRK
jgi:fluoride ion exporter CrcB/FEX